MYGKCLTHLLRLCGAIHNINKATEIGVKLKNSNKKQITQEFVSDFESNINNFKKDYQKISAETVNQAALLLEYFNSQRVIIAGYNTLNLNGTNLEQELKNYLSMNSPQPTIIESTAKEIKKAMKCILLTKTVKVCAGEINQKNRIPIDDVIKAFDLLQDLSIGERISEPNDRGHTIHYLNKPSLRYVKDNFNIAALIQSCGVKLKDYEATFPEHSKDDGFFGNDLMENNKSNSNENTKRVGSNEDDDIHNVTNVLNDEEQEEHEKQDENDEELRTILSRAGEESKEKRINKNSNRSASKDDIDTVEEAIELGKHKLSSHSINQDKDKIKKIDKESNNDLETSASNELDGVYKELGCSRSKLSYKKINIGNDEIADHTNLSATDSKNGESIARKSTRNKGKKQA